MPKFTQKARKDELPDKAPITIHSVGALSSIVWSGIIRVVSIDIGTSNYCLRVETRTLDAWPLVNTLFQAKISFKGMVVDLDGHCILYSMITRWLEQYKQLIGCANLVCIERQMPINTRCVRIMQHTISYFLTLMSGTNACIMEVDPTLPKRLLGKPSEFSDTACKKIWSPGTAKLLLQARGDIQTYQLIEQAGKKQDDHSDVVIQIEAVFIYCGYPSTYQMICAAMGIKRLMDPMLTFPTIAAILQALQARGILVYGSQAAGTQDAVISWTVTPTPTLAAANDTITITW